MGRYRIYTLSFELPKSFRATDIEHYHLSYKHTEIGTVLALACGVWRQKDINLIKQYFHWNENQQTYKTKRTLKKNYEDSEIKNRKLSFENYSAKKQIQMNVQELFYQLCMESGNVEITI